ncbi:MAG: hypothetical protein HZA20_02980 [Nitrospirae bacterium]|nr:hypothetical protein [Nitrospirota bacterium]
MLRRYVFLLLMLFPAVTPSYAASVNGESRTYVQTRETVGGGKVAPLYEYLDLNIEEMAGQKLSFHAGGWFRVDLADDSGDKRSEGDLRYGYLNFRSDDANAMVDAGRILVHDGIASEIIDGIHATADLKAGFGVSAFAGDIIESGGELIYGGRISHKAEKLYTVGVSFLQGKNDKTGDREEMGIDLSLRPADKVSILGQSSYNSETSGWMEHSYFLNVGGLGSLKLRGEVSLIDYANYFQAASINAFAPKTGSGSGIDTEETLLTTGVELEYPVNENVTVSVDYKNYEYDRAGTVNRYGAKFAYVKDSDVLAGASAHRMNGYEKDNRYNEIRAYCFSKSGKLDKTIDALAVIYDEKVSGVKTAYSLTAAAGYALSERAKASADFEYSHNPYYDKEVKGFLKFIYKFGTNPWGA